MERKEINWTDSLEEKLIELVEPQRILWDKRHPNYYRQDMASQRWKQIGDEIGCTGCDAAHQFGLIKRRYKRYLEKEKIGSRSGASAFKGKPFFLADKMNFLRDTFIRRRTVESLRNDIPYPENSNSSPAPLDSTLKISQPLIPPKSIHTFPTTSPILHSPSLQLNAAVTPTTIHHPQSQSPPLILSPAVLRPSVSPSPIPITATIMYPPQSPSPTLARPTLQSSTSTSSSLSNNSMFSPPPRFSPSPTCTPSPSDTGMSSSRYRALIAKEMKSSYALVREATKEITNCASTIAQKHAAADKAPETSYTESILQFLQSAINRLNEERQEEFLEKVIQLFLEIKNRKD